MSKIEEVAAAIYHCTPRNKPFDKLAPNFKRYWEKRALAALRALHEPYEGMLVAGDRAIFRADPDWQSNACWRAMIDHLLSEVEAKP